MFDEGFGGSVETAYRPMFEVRPIEEWQRIARKRPMPKKLFGEFWYEGELCLLFGESGSGKSILAMQIAESVASGRAVEPLKMTAEPQNVLYVDLEMSEKQLEMRYSDEPKEGQKTLKNHYKFPKNRIFWAQFNPLGDLPKGCKRFEDGVYEHLREEIAKKQIGTVIMEDITFLRRANGHVEPLLAMMRRLRLLKAEFGVSVLVLMTAHRRNEGRPLGIGHLGVMHMLSRLADSVVGIGQSRSDGETRYLKEILHRNHRITYGESHVPAFVIERRDGNFLSFAADSFWHESHFLTGHQSRAILERAVRIQRMSASGMTQREIAEHLSISLGSVNRYVNMELPEQYRPRPPAPEPAASGVVDDEAEQWQPREERYPGEETDLAMVRMGFGAVHRPELYEKGSAVGVSVGSNGDAGKNGDAGPADDAEDNTNGGHAEDHSLPPYLRTLKQEKDTYGKILYVEEWDDQGKRKKWLDIDRKGCIQRWTRSLMGISGSPYEPPEATEEET